MTEVLNRNLRAVRQPIAAKMATGFEFGKLLSQNELQRLPSQPRPNSAKCLGPLWRNGNLPQRVGSK
jgi:hypothetical protein